MMGSTNKAKDFWNLCSEDNCWLLNAQEVFA
jgi:hypothetical protein